MQNDWRPEPTPEEREALDRALERALAERRDHRGAWWREGVQESISAEDESEPKYQPGPRVSRVGAAS